MKILVIPDLHGQAPKIPKGSFDLIIAVGDFCSDSVKKYEFEAYKKSKKLNKDITFIDVLGKAKSIKLINQSMIDGRKILEKLNNVGVPVLVVPGNWDTTDYKLKLQKKAGIDIVKKTYENFLIKDLKNVINIYQSSYETDEFIFIGHGETAFPEFPDKRELANMSKKDINKRKKYFYNYFIPVDFQFRLANKPVIFVSHNVPYNTKLDKIMLKESPMFGKHFGSLIAREIIEKYQPVMCIGAHMHEYLGKCKIGNTVVINAGFGADVATIVETQNSKVKKIDFLDPKNKYHKGILKNYKL